jgi:DNA-directed RNA polymerase subunit M/transcription elongation factor TFIIS
MIEQAHQQQPNEMQRQRLATITVERPRCPACGDVRLRKYRSIRDQGDGSALWWVRCTCGHRFRVLLE